VFVKVTVDKERNGWRRALSAEQVSRCTKSGRIDRLELLLRVSESLPDMLDYLRLVGQRAKRCGFLLRAKVRALTTE
jgi:hypothetical protein